MIANLHDIFTEYVPVAAVMVVGIGYLIGSWRRGLADTWKETVEAQSVELKVLGAKNARIEVSANECKEAIANLRGQVSALIAENRDLRGLVMLDTALPPALIAHLDSATRSVMAEVAISHADQTATILAAMAAMTEGK